MFVKTLRYCLRRVPSEAVFCAVIPVNIENIENKGETLPKIINVFAVTHTN